MQAFDSTSDAESALSAELVWDTETAATVAAGGLALTAGLSAGWSPPLLLAAAAGASLMATFLELAKASGVDVLGYVADQRVAVGRANNVRSVSIVASITVPSTEAARRAETLWTAAVERAPVVAVIACPLTFERSIVALSEAGQ